MMRTLFACFAGTLFLTGAAFAQSSGSPTPAPSSTQGRAPVQAGDPGPTDPATGMTKRENYDAQLNSGATDNSTATPAGSDEQKAR